MDAEWDFKDCAPMESKEEMLRALETVILQESRTELRRLAMQRYLEMTEKDNGSEAPPRL